MFEYSSSASPPPERKILSYDNMNFRMPLPHSLWAHVIANSSKYLYCQIKEAKVEVKDKSVLEVGAGVALPSLAAFRAGAKRVVISEYAEECLIDNLKYNLVNNGLTSVIINKLSECRNIPLSIYPCTWDRFETSEDKFDIIIMCDVVFNHHEHANLVKLIVNNLAKDGVVFFYFQFHCPDKQTKDMQFFDQLEQHGLYYKLQESFRIGCLFPNEDEIYAKWDIVLRENLQCYVVKWV